MRRTNDYFFKYVFGSEEGTDVLIDFLNATQNRPPHNRIKTVKLEDREIDPERYLDKAIRLDIVATTELGHVYQIEVQVADQVFIDQRSLYCSGKFPIRSTFPKGSDPNVILIKLLNTC